MSHTDFGLVMSSQATQLVAACKEQKNLASQTEARVISLSGALRALTTEHVAVTASANRAFAELEHLTDKHDWLQDQVFNDFSATSWLIMTWQSSLTQRSPPCLLPACATKAAHWH